MDVELLVERGFRRSKEDDDRDLNEYILLIETLPENILTSYRQGEVFHYETLPELAQKISELKKEIGESIYVKNKTSGYGGSWFNIAKDGCVTSERPLSQKEFIDLMFKVMKDNNLSE